MPIREPVAANAVNFDLRTITVPGSTAVNFDLSELAPPVGVVLDPEAGETDGSGVFAGTLTSDIPVTDDGAVVLVIDTDDATGIVVGRSTVRPT